MSGDVVLSQVIEDAKLFFSGIEQFDNLLDGLQSSQTLCIAGPSLSGKSRVCSQFCTEALTKHMRVLDQYWRTVEFRFCSSINFE